MITWIITSLKFIHTSKSLIVSRKLYEDHHREEGSMEEIDEFYG